MWSAAQIQYAVVLFLVVLFSICSCEAKIAPFGGAAPGLDTSTERSTSTTTDTNTDTETESDLSSGVDSGTDTETGLMGSYFRRYGFKDFVFCRHDENINFDWSEALPEEFSTNGGLLVKWEGWITPEFSETYTFQTVSDDGVRLWINDVLIIDDWLIRPEATNTGMASLLANVPAKIIIEYFSLPDFSFINVSWESPSLPLETIPAQRFTSNGCGVPPVDLPPDAIEGTCLQPDDFDDDTIAPVWQLEPLGPVGEVTASETDVLKIVIENGYYIGSAFDTGAFLYQTANGNADVSYRVDTMAMASANAETGLMMRNSLEPDALMVFVGLTGLNRVRMFARKQVGVLAESLTNEEIPSLPYWVRLHRTGDLFEGYISADGTNWQLINSAVVSINENYLVGIAQSSQSSVRSIGTGGNFAVTEGSCK